MRNFVVYINITFSITFTSWFLVVRLVRLSPWFVDRWLPSGFVLSSQ